MRRNKECFMENKRLVEKKIENDIRKLTLAVVYMSMIVLVIFGLGPST